MITMGFRQQTCRETEYSKMAKQNDITDNTIQQSEASSETV